MRGILSKLCFIPHFIVFYGTPVFPSYRYPNIVDNSTLPTLQLWLARDKNAQGK